MAVIELAVVIPVHNGLGHTRRCLESLRDFAPHVPVYVVDDGSTDGTREFLDTAVGVSRIEGTGTLWWSASVNLGCRTAIAAGAERLLLLNNDNVIPSNLIDELVRVHAERGGCVSAPVLRSWNGETGDVVMAGGTLDWEARGIGLREHGGTFVPDNRVDEVDWLPGGPLLFSAEVFDLLGAFDERRFPQYRGDVDFTTRARKAGYSCLVTWRTYVLNDQTQTGLNFARRLMPWTFVQGLFTLRSNYNLRETFAFARRHCPPGLRARYLTLFYLRYAYAAAKTWLPRRSQSAV